MHNKEVKSFYLEGIVGDNNIMTTRERLILNMESDMRDEGFVPLLDVDPVFTLDYNEGEENYRFELTIVGIFLGRDEAWNVGGMMNGKAIQRYTPSAKLSQSSSTQALK